MNYFEIGLQFAFVFISAFTTLYISEYMKRPRLEIDSIKAYKEGNFTKFYFEIRNREGFWFLERHSAQDCKGDLRIVNPESDMGFKIHELKSRMIWDDDRFGRNLVEKMNIFSGEKASIYGLAKSGSDFHIMHNEKLIEDLDGEMIENTDPISDQVDDFEIIVRARNGSELREKFEFSDLNELT
jgi:hypothetical protein